MTTADDGALSGDASDAPSWISVGKKLHWWSESQKKNMSVVVAKVDGKKKLVYVTFEVDKSAYKSVPFAKIGKKDCPLRNPDEKEQPAKKTPEDASATKSKEKKRKDEDRDRSATPDWWSKEQMKQVEVKKAKREQMVAEEKRKEEEKKREEQKRRALVEAERKKVQEAFEKRKREAEAQQRKEEEEWRQSLVKRRAEEAAEEEIKMQEKEERRKKRREEKKEKEKREKEIADGVVPPQTAPPPLPGQLVHQPIVVPPKVGAVNPPPPPVAPAVQGMPVAQPWQWPQMPGMTAQSPPMHASAMHMMGLGQPLASGANNFAFGGVNGATSNGIAGSNSGLVGAWGALGNSAAGVLPTLPPGPHMMPTVGIAATGDGGCSAPGTAHWGSHWTGMPLTGGHW